ncbi:MAG: glycosyltransferase, partial [Gammaproteobacteria bacterium]|nr:glycosyltransferase [Gammaproteobacteria bacterium]
KNFVGLLNAWHSSTFLRKEFTLICFGGGPLTRSEKSTLSSLNIAPDEVTAIQGGDDILSWLYEQAACFVHPSLYEGFGIPLLEAMSKNCPIACSNQSALPEVAGDAATYFDPNDPLSMASALEQLLLSEENRSNAISKGRLRVQEFSWEKCALDTLKVYENSLA